MEKGIPNRPQPKAVVLNPRSTAVLVLDLSAHCHDEKASCHKLLQPVGAFLDVARAAEIPVLFTVVIFHKGIPMGEVAAPLKRQEHEPVFYPEGYDKFHGGAIQAFLQPKGVDTVVLVGASTNFAVLYTCTTAARMLRYNVIIPMDGVAARTDYEQEYSFHQMTVLPRVDQIRFTTLKAIQFSSR